MLHLNFHNVTECARMCPNVPECARMCLCYGLECAAGVGLPVNAFCVSHVLAGVTFCWWTSTRTYMFIPLLWSEPIAGSAPTTAHISSGTSASHTRPKSHTPSAFHTSCAIFVHCFTSFGPSVARSVGSPAGRLVGRRRRRCDARSCNGPGTHVHKILEGSPTRRGAPLL